MAFTLTKNGGGTVVCSYLTITNSTGSPASTWYAVSSTDGGSNSGWTFSAPTSALPRLAYNSRWIDFPYQIWRIQDDPIHATLRNQSASKVEELLNVSVDQVVDLAWRWFTNANDATLKRNLRQWFEWAQQGGAWYIALDNGQTVLTTLSAAASAGATTVTVTSAMGIIVGKLYVIRSATKYQLVKVSAISSTTITLTEALDFDVASGDRFRSEQYWQGRLVNNTNPIVEMPPLHYDFNLTFREDVQSI